MSSCPLSLVFCLAATLTVGAGPVPARAGCCRLEKIMPERLPDLTIPRSGHCIFYANGELTIVGGHTTNFVPTATAEYFADGTWHLLHTAYTHDNGFAVGTHSRICPPAQARPERTEEEFIIGGGHAEELGVGQTFTLERYTPQTHTFEGFGCLDRRRTLANAAQLPDGRVIISGNHYADDAIGCYDGSSQVQHIKPVVQGYNSPYILPVAKDDAIIFGCRDTHAMPLDTIMVNRLKGDAFRELLLEQWHLFYQDIPFSSDASFIGDKQAGDFSYLLFATNDSGLPAIIQVRTVGAGPMPDRNAGTEVSFTLLPTACPIPIRSPFGPIVYKSPVIADRQRQRAYVIGMDSLCTRQYILAIDYAQRPAAVTLHYTDSLEHSTYTTPVLTPDGDIILAGGMADTNYKPLAAVWLYRFGTAVGADPNLQSSIFRSALPLGSSKNLLSFWIAIALLTAALITYILLYRRRTKSSSVGAGPVPARNNQDHELLHRICQYMDEQQPYLQSRLRQSDVAATLGVSTASISDCLNACRGITFAQFLAEYRVRHAQQLLSTQPDMKISAVYEEAGFTSQTTFFRSFKAVTGLSPKEWLARQ